MFILKNTVLKNAAHMSPVEFNIDESPPVGLVIARKAAIWAI